MDHFHPIRMRAIPTQMPWLLPSCHQRIYQLVRVSRSMDLSRGRYFK